MIPQLTDDQRHALHEAHDTGPIVVVDPTTATSYVMLRADLYDRYRMVFEEEFDVREAYRVIDEVAGKRRLGRPKYGRL